MRPPPEYLNDYVGEYDFVNPHDGPMPENIRVVREGDLLVGEFTFPGKPGFVGWGHSNWGTASALAQGAAGVRRLALFHHRPRRSDDQLDQIEAEAKGDFAGEFAAYDDLDLTL